LAKSKQAGKNQEGLGERIFARLPVQQNWTETADILRSPSSRAKLTTGQAEIQNRKIFIPF